MIIWLQYICKYISVTKLLLVGYVVHYISEVSKFLFEFKFLGIKLWKCGTIKYIN
jgi:ABC-type iron transport system FetAB permease component